MITLWTSWELEPVMIISPTYTRISNKWPLTLLKKSEVSNTEFVNHHWYINVHHGVVRFQENSNISKKTQLSLLLLFVIVPLSISDLNIGGYSPITTLWSLIGYYFAGFQPPNSSHSTKAIPRASSSLIDNFPSKTTLSKLLLYSQIFLCQQLLIEFS